MFALSSRPRLPTRLARLSRAATVALTAAIVATTASANIVHLAPNGIGQVLIFPYYTTRATTVSLVSLVNTTVEAKAVRINVREARRGAIVARINLYLSAKDVWTGAFIDDGEGASLISNDTSCTAPVISSSSALKLSNGEFVNDSPTANLVRDSRDRTREGYLEVIEMAAISNASFTGKNVTHNAGKPACAAGITDVTYEPPLADLKAPTGGLMGTLSFVNVSKGMLASTAASALDGFWLTGPNAPAPRVIAANSSAIDLTSGKNTSVAHSGSTKMFQPVTSTTERFISRFSNSIDAVTVAFMAQNVSSEYAFTEDRVVATTLLINMPTKPYYILGNTPAPFQRLWTGTDGTACDDTGVNSVDREEFIAVAEDTIGPPPPSYVFPALCYVTSPVVPGKDSRVTADQTFLGSMIASGRRAIQSQGATVVQPGKEGGHLELFVSYPGSNLTPVESSILQRNNTGTLIWTPATASTLYGLPMIGFTLSQAAYQTGSPQQNYADATPLRFRSSVITTAPTAAP